MSADAGRDLPLLDATRPRAAAPTRAPASGGRRVYVETYGCQMNLADSEVVTSILSAAGFSITDRPEEADVVLINTCAVREHAEERVLGRAAQLSGLRRERPHLVLGILGCMAQRLADRLPQRAPGVDLVMGPDSYRRLPEALAETSDEALLHVRLSRGEDYAGIDPARREGTNAWVTVMRGCDKFCTFCIVPYVRGRERSVPCAEVLRQVRSLAGQGFREVTLLGQTVSSYRNGDVDFAGLLKGVAAVDGIDRVRFMSPHPADFDERTIEALAHIPEVCPSLHLPVQSGSDAQLGAMRRGYTVAEYRSLVDRLRQAVPDLCLTTDVVVGFCGETDDDFAHTLRLLHEVRFDSAFMFRYSQREGTHAARHMPDDVPNGVKAERLQRLIAVQEAISQEVSQRFVGRTVPVLVEGPSRRPGESGPTWYGRSPHGKVVVFGQETPANQEVSVRVDRASSHSLFGGVVNPTEV